MLSSGKFLFNRLLYRPQVYNGIRNLANEAYVTYSNGQKIPQLGYGTWKTKPEEAYDATMVALEAGYRHFDCAYNYENEKEIGRAFANKFQDGTIKREDLFITGKLWNTFHRRDWVEQGLQLTLNDLGVDYLDSYLVHWPTAYKEGTERLPKDEKGNFIYSNASYLETWKGMEDLVDSGRVKSIGLSNFNSKQIQEVLDIARIKPVSLQIELHPYLSQDKLVNFCAENGIKVTAHSPIGSRDRPWVTDTAEHPYILEDPKVVAIAKRLGRTSAQVVLRWGIQRGIVVIPKSVTPSRIRSNTYVYDFNLTDADMALLNSFDSRYYRGVLHPWLAGHPNYPFSEEF